MTTQLHATHLTGIGVIDEQHEVILERVDEFARSALCGEREQNSLHLNAVLSAILDHFEFEERLMEQAGYPFLKVHKRLHDYFIQRLAGYTQRYDSGEDIAEEMVMFLHDWLHNHFTREDRDYSPLILAEIEGVTPDTDAANGTNWLSRVFYKFA